MRTTCHSNHRCNRRDCPTCRWRYSGRVARRILDRTQGHLYAIEIDTALHTFADFSVWRVESRNLIDHRRRACRWWRDLSLAVWLGKDGRVRGTASLGAVTVGEFEVAVGRRWPVTLRAIDPATVREAVYRAIRPGLIADVGSGRGRYQPLKFAVWPRCSQHSPVLQSRENAVPTWIEPLPLIF